MKQQKIYLFSSMLMSIVLVLSQIAAVKADTLGAIVEYSNGSGSTGMSGITEGPDGNLWFNEWSTRKIGKMTKSGTILAKYTLPTDGGSPNSISRGSDGNLWFTTSTIKFGKISTSGTISMYNFNANHPGSSYNIISGPDGYMYMGSSNGTSNNSYVQKINTSGSLVRAYNTSGQVIESTADHANNLVWYIARGLTSTGGSSNIRIVGKIDIDGNHVQYAAPTEFGDLSSITMGPDGKPWFTGVGDKIGNVDIDGNFSQPYTIPGSMTNPSKIRSGLDGNLWVTLYNANKIARVSTSGTINLYSAPGGWIRPAGLTPGTDGNMWFIESAINKIAKIGTGTSSTSTDEDNDGLSAGLELVQGTSDFDPDTDGDGLSDHTESTTFSNRTTVFCGTTCAYPDPLSKDLYVEIDWMVNGSFSTKPTSQDLEGAAVAYGNKGIRLHIDTGSFGGGNQVNYSYDTMTEPTANVIDYFDFKRGGDGVASQFDYANRYKVWRYMLSVDRITTPDNQTDLNGAGINGDDDSLLAYGKLSSDYSGTTLSEEIQQTIIHEFGHNLCLAQVSTYIGHDSSCIYPLIDTSQAPSTYVSAMKYNGTVLDLSSGVNYPNDHDDWSAVLNKGFDDFANSEQGDYEYAVLNGAVSQGSTKDKSKKRLFSITKKDRLKN